MSVSANVYIATAGLLALSGAGRAVEGSGSETPAYKYGLFKTQEGKDLPVCEIAVQQAWLNSSTGDKGVACATLAENALAPSRAHECDCYKFVTDTEAREKLQCSWPKTTTSVYDRWHACNIDNIQPLIDAKGKTLATLKKIREMRQIWYFTLRGCWWNAELIYLCKCITVASALFSDVWALISFIHTDATMTWTSSKGTTSDRVALMKASWFHQDINWTSHIEAGDTNLEGTLTKPFDACTPLKNKISGIAIMTRGTCNVSHHLAVWCRSSCSVPDVGGLIHDTWLVPSLHKVRFICSMDPLTVLTPIIYPTFIDTVNSLTSN
jgi:hypothetical protein